MSRRILFYRYASICEPDIIAVFKMLGHTVDEETTEIYKKDFPPAECVQLMGKRLMDTAYDCVFSINFFPTLAEVCNIFKIPYVCWIVDSPVLELYSHAISKPYNRIFFFDRILYNEFYPKNPDGIFYMPLATNMEHNDEMIGGITEADRKNFTHDISFVGSLYKEKSSYNKIEEKLDDYLKGYFEGLIESQYLIYGYNFMEDILEDDIVKRFTDEVGEYPFPELSDDNQKAVLAQLVLNTRVAELERYRLLGKISEYFDVNVYTGSDTSSIPKVKNRGLAKSFDEMPKIFHLSKINLNITAKPIRSGLSLRIWDVLGCGGFLISNYQEELPEYFEIGKEIETYSSEQELLGKIQYYLENDKEREAIAEKGYKKVKAMHSYVHRIRDIMNIVFGDE